MTTGHLGATRFERATNPLPTMDTDDQTQSAGPETPDAADYAPG